MLCRITDDSKTNTLTQNAVGVVRSFFDIGFKMSDRWLKKIVVQLLFNQIRDA